MKKYIIALLFTLSLIGSSYAGTVDTYFRYSVTSEVNHNNLNGNLDLIRNTINGNLNNANTATNFRLFEILSALPLAGDEGRIVFRTTDDTLNIDNGSAWVYSPTYLGDAVQGDILYFDGTTWARLTAGTAGNFLQASGPTTDPSWNAINLAGGTNYVTGLLPLLNGGTNAGITASPGSVIYSDSTGFAQARAGVSGNFLQSNGTSAPDFAKVDLASAVDVTGVLPIGSGGTGSATGTVGGDLTGTLPNPTLATGIPKNIQAFTSTGTWTRPAGIDIVYVKVWGGGGGGGSIVTAPGGGGGGGGYSEGLVAVTGNVTVTIGAGGAAETAGGNSSFAGSTTPTANGGAAASNQTGGAGGAASNGTIDLTGGTGATSAGTTQSGGAGGGSSMGGAGGGGGGGNGSGAGATGAIGASPGGGGGGGGGSSAGTGTGGAGADGLVIVYY